MTGCDYIVCVLSTAFLQRGTAGMFSTRDRTMMALRGGADAVFALPVRFSCAPADQFALGGVSILRALGVVTAQAFGCEDAALLPQLQAAAKCLNGEPAPFREALRIRLQSGAPYPAAQASAVEAACGVPARLLGSPNNILAVAYLRQLDGTGIRPIAIQRQGLRSDDTGTDFPPSSVLRRRLRDGDTASALGAVPAESAALISDCLAEGRVCAPEALTQALLYRVYTTGPEEWAKYAPHAEGLEHRLRAALDADPATREQLLARLKTRRYTRSALERWLTAILLELDPHDGPAAPQYLRLLGFRDSARPLLRAIRDRAILPVITKPGHDPAPLGEDARAERLWSLGAGRPDNLFRQSPVIYYTDKEST